MLVTLHPTATGVPCDADEPGPAGTGRSLIPSWRRFALGAALAALAALFVARVAGQTVLDLDVFHQMALFRAALQLGRMPTHDLFAYTSTSRPSVHYEWGNGAILYAVTATTGAPGLLAFKYLLTAAVGAMAVRVALLRGANWKVLCALGPAAILLLEPAFSTVRAGLFTLLFCAMLLAMLERDRRGGRWWVLPWLGVYVLWLNIHPGFIVGAGFLALYWLERVIRLRIPQWHLVATGAAMALLVLVNPYGRLYPMALWHAMTMKLPPIGEWLPMWADRSCPTCVAVYGLTVLVGAYAVARAGWRRCEGVFLLLAGIIASLQHVRHVYLYALVWVCYVPAWFSVSPLGEAISHAWTRWPRLIGVVSSALAVALVPVVVVARPWRLHLPVELDDAANVRGDLAYPGGAVRYLKSQRFRGNVMTHYNDGSYVMWHLWPDVRVSMDSRNDVGYDYELITEVLDFYRGGPGWLATLKRYPTDIVLVKRSYPLAKLMDSAPGWRRFYRDNAYELWSRPDLDLPKVDRTGVPLGADFP
jgi:hypothetical protein